VPDRRFQELVELFRPRKQTPVTIEVLDVPGFDRLTDPKLRTAAFGEVRKADGLAVVLDLFHDSSSEHAVGSLREVWDELVFADYAVVEKGIEGVEMAAKSKQNPDAQRRYTFLRMLQPHLENGAGIRGLPLDEEAERLVRQYGLLTGKPVLVVANLAESDLAEGERSAAARALRSFCGERGWPLFVLSAAVEHEIAQLPADDRTELLAAYHLDEPVLHRFLRAAYAGLDLVTFFTVGEDEVRGWTVRRDTPARRAAGVIHSDLERGFIRGEVIHCSTLLETGSLNEAKKKGVLRLEGKDYPVQDGDILHVRFSV
ncbi:MAG: DUF933 domain-containing protein, partial [Candidatus Eisenbacteria bacterium]|nr:DUF933 domain-containing protein [Candidatus Eisenbacteria bacterium]